MFKDLKISFIIIVYFRKSRDGPSHDHELMDAVLSGEIFKKKNLPFKSSPPVIKKRLIGKPGRGLIGAGRRKQLPCNGKTAQPQGFTRVPAEI